MKVWGTAFLLGLAACAAPPRPEPRSAAAPEARASVDALRVDLEYRPAPQGAECAACFFELHPRAYVAQGWAWNPCACAFWVPCRHRRLAWPRPCWD